MTHGFPIPAHPVKCLHSSLSMHEVTSISLDQILADERYRQCLFTSVEWDYKPQSEIT